MCPHHEGTPVPADFMLQKLTSADTGEKRRTAKEQMATAFRHHINFKFATEWFGRKSGLGGSAGAVEPSGPDAISGRQVNAVLWSTRKGGGRPTMK